MSRAAHFFRNAGTANLLKLLVLSILVLLALSKDFSTGLWTLSVPAFAAGVAIPFFIREWLLAQFSVVRIVMNGIAIVAIVLAVLMGGRGGSEPAWLRISLAFVIAFYVSAFFWMLSDERIGSE